MSCKYKYKGKEYTKEALIKVLSSDPNIVNKYRPQEQRIAGQRESLVAFSEKIEHLQSKLNVEVVIDNDVPTSRVLSKSDPRTKRAGKPVILINPDAVFKDTAIHEFAHVFIDAFPDGLKNRRLQKALNSLKGSIVWSEVSKNYPEVGNEQFQKEVLATAIGREGAELWDSRENDGAWSAFKNWFFDFLHRTFGIGKSEVLLLTEDLLDSGATNLVGSEFTQEQRFGNPDNIKNKKNYRSIDTLYKEILSRINNLQIIYAKTTQEEKMDEALKRAEGEITGKQTPLQQIEELQEQLDLYQNVDNMKGAMEYVHWTKGQAKGLLSRIKTAKEKGELTDEIIQDYKTYTGAFDLVEDIKKSLITSNENLPEEDKQDLTEELAELDSIIQDYSNIGSELLATQRIAYSKFMAKNSRTQDAIYREKFSKDYDSVQPDISKLEYINAKMQETATERAEEAEAVYLEQAQKSMMDISAGSMLLFSEKSINSEEIGVASGILDNADFKKKQFMESQVEEFKKSHAEFIKDGVNASNDKLIDVDANGHSYLISKYKAEYVSAHKAAKDLKNNEELRDKTYAEAAKNATSTNYTFNGKSKKIRIWKAKNIKVDGTDFTYDSEGESFRVPIIEVIAANEFTNWKNDNTNRIVEPDGSSYRVPKGQWVNPKYDALNEVERKTLRFLTTKAKEAETLSKEKKSLMNNVEGINFISLPGITKTSFERASRGDVKSLTIDKLTDMVNVKADEEHLFGKNEENKDKSMKKVMADVSNKEKLEVPVPFRRRLEAKEQSTDLHTIFLMNLDGAKNHEVKSGVEASLLTLIDVMGNRLVPHMEGVNKIMRYHNMKSKEDIQLHYPKDKLPNDVKKMLDMVEHRVYGITTKDAGDIAGMNIQKLTSTVLKYGGSVALIGNFLNSAVNATTGTMNNLMEAIGGETYNLKDWRQAKLDYVKDLQNLSIVKDMGSVAETSRTNMLLNSFDVLGDSSVTNNRFEANNRVKALLKGNSLRPFANAGEHMMQAQVMYATLNSIKMTNKEGKYLDKNGKIVSSKNKAASLKDVITFDNRRMQIPKWAKYTTFNPDGGTILEDTKRLITKKIIDLHGNYHEELKSAAQREWWGKLVFFLRKWMESTINRRWRGAANFHKSSDELREVDKFFSQDMKAYQEGSYTTILRFMNQLRKAGKDFNLALIRSNYQNLTAHEKGNIRRVGAELSMITMTILAYMAAGGFDDDPDEDTLMARYYLRRELSELSFYMNPAETLKIASTPTAAIGVTKKLTKVIGQFTSPLEEYKTGKNKGRNKLAVKMLKMTPITSQTEKDLEASLRFLQNMD